MSSQNTVQDFKSQSNSPRDSKPYHQQKRKDTPRESNPTAKQNQASGIEPEELRSLRANYGDHIETLNELFPNWKDEDLLFVMQETNGDLDLAISRISEGHASQWAEAAKPRKKKPEAADPNAWQVNGQQRGQSSQRGGRGGARGGRRGDQSSRGGKPNRGSFRSGPSSRPVQPQSWSAPADNNTPSTWGEAPAAASWAESTEPSTGDWGKSAPDVSVPESAPTEAPTASDVQPKPVSQKVIQPWGAVTQSNAKTPEKGVASSSIAQPAKAAQPTKPIESKPAPQVAPNAAPKAKGTWAQIVKPVEPPKVEPPKVEPKPVAKPAPQQAAASPSPAKSVASSRDGRGASPNRQAAKADDSEQRRSVSPLRESHTPQQSFSPEKPVESSTAPSPAKTAPSTPSRSASPVRSSQAQAPVLTASQSASPSASEAKKKQQPPQQPQQSAQRRPLKQDAAVALPGSAGQSSGLEGASGQGVGAMFGSLSLSSSEPQPQHDQQQAQTHAASLHSAGSASETAPVAQSPKKSQHENLSQASGPPHSHQQQLHQQHQPTYSAKGPEDSYLQQSQSQLPSHSYSAQGSGQINTPDALGGPYGSYLGSHPQHSQPHSQQGGLGGFGAPVGGVPGEAYGNLYGNEVQRSMGYYDPTAYSQTHSAAGGPSYAQSRDNKYSSAETISSAQSSVTAASTQAQPQGQQFHGLHAGSPYYPYYYVPNQFGPNAYQQTGYGQPHYGSKSMYPMYGAHQQHPSQHQLPGGKPTPGSPYGGYPSSTANANAAHGYGQQGYDDMVSYGQSTPAQQHQQQHSGDYKGYGSQISQLPNFLSGPQQPSQSANGGNGGGPNGGSSHVPKPGDGVKSSSSSYGKYGDQSVKQSGGGNGGALPSSGNTQPLSHNVGQQQAQSGHHPQQQQGQGAYYQPQYGYYSQNYGHPFPQQQQQQQHYSGHQGSHQQQPQQQQQQPPQQQQLPQGSAQRGGNQYWGSQS